MGLNLKRIALGVGTGGLSEVARGAKEGGIKGAVMGGLDPTGLSRKALEGLGINLEGKEAPYIDPAHQQAGLFNAFAGDYDNQMKLADKGVQESALTKGLFGAGGLQEQLGNEQRDLSSRGFSLQQPDYEAYGQVSGDISRLFGQQEQNTTQALARRGLASAGSGAAGAAFSGLAGNKNEMLAKAQTDTAQRRMADTRARLNDIRGQMQSLGMQGAGLAQDRYNAKGGSLLNSANIERGMNTEQMAARQEQRDNYTPGFGDALKAGLMSSVSNIGAAPGNFAGSAAGAGGKAAGKSMFG